MLVDGVRVNSCLTLAVRLEGAEVTTVEGLASGDELHSRQQEFIAEDAFQCGCGYCIPPRSCPASPASRRAVRAVEQVAGGR